MGPWFTKSFQEINGGGTALNYVWGMVCELCISSMNVSNESRIVGVISHLYSRGKLNVVTIFPTKSAQCLAVELLYEQPRFLSSLGVLE